VIGHLVRSLHGRDVGAFESLLQREPWLLGDDCIWLQNDLIGKATLSNDRVPFVTALFDRHPAILRRQRRRSLKRSRTRSRTPRPISFRY
jgi:hypothetical protein